MSKSLRGKICAQKLEEVLSEWFRLAAYVASVEEFEENMLQVYSSCS